MERDDAVGLERGAEKIVARELRHDDLLETSAGQWEYVFTVLPHAKQFVAVRTIEGHFTYLIYGEHEVQVQR